MKNLFKSLIIFSALFCFVNISTVFAETNQEKGWRIMKAIDQMPVIQKLYSENTFKIYDSQGKLIFTKRARSASFVEDYKDPDKRLSRSISYFYSPADDKGNGALMLEKPGDEDDDQWIYLKGLRKPKRVIGSDKSSSFMGSDFSNGDVAARDINDYIFTWQGTDIVEFKGKKIKVEKIQNEFKSKQKKEDYGYNKSVIWVHAKSGLVFKGEMYNLNNQLFKKMRMISFAVKKNKDGKKVFMATGMEMKNMLKGTKTIMDISNLKVEKKAKKVNPSIFSLKYLTRKWW